MMEDVAFERHFTVYQLAEIWGCSHMTVRRKIDGQPGVIDIGSDETRWSRKRKTFRVPESVAIRIHREMRAK